MTTRNLNFPPAYPHDPRVQSGEAKIADPEMRLQAFRQAVIKVTNDIPYPALQYIEALEAKISQMESDKGWEASARHAERSGGTL